MWDAIMQFLQQFGQQAGSAGSTVSNGLGKVNNVLGSASPALQSVLDIMNIRKGLGPQQMQMEPINRNSQTGQPTPFQLPAAQSAAGAGNNQQLIQLIQSLLRK